MSIIKSWPEAKAIIFILAASILYGSVGTIVKLIDMDHLHTTTLVFYRVFIATITLFVCLILTKSDFRFRRDELKLNTLMGILLVLAFGTYTVANVFAPIQNVSILSSMAPFAVIILAYIFLREKISRHELFSLLVAFSAIIIMNSIKLANNIGNILAILNSVVVAIILIIEKKKAITGNVGFIFRNSVVTCLFLIPAPLIFGFGALSSKDIGLLLLLGVGTGIASFLAFQALKYMNVGRLSIIESIATPLAAIILGIVIIHEALTLSIIIGGILLICASVFLKIRRLNLRSRMNQARP